MDSVRVPPQVFALDDRRMSYLGLEEGGDLYCRECAVEPLAEDCFQAGPLGGRVRDGEAFLQSLDALMAKTSLRPSEASLVVPDNWLRLTFVEAEEWPRSANDQMEVLRFKLGRIVPFRVEELRIAAEAVPTLDGESGYRFLVGFGIESAFRQIEDAFAARDVRIGSISNSSLSLLPALREGLESATLAAVLAVSDGRYGLIVTRNGRPLVYRGKAHGAGSSMATVARELRLTKNFLQERVSPGILSEIVLVASESQEPQWREVLEETFERPVSSLGREWPSIPGLTTLQTHDAAPLVGAALAEVA